jgi:hypothetical protein
MIKGMEEIEQLAQDIQKEMMKRIKETEHLKEIVKIQQEIINTQRTTIDAQKRTINFTQGMKGLT